ncbi:hypothetical protein [Vallitalea guaymasensis]|uniref:hypothetical protein n=1 Tax=Vallitalea guaymasensis TaxID=1185412 RepID=UPI000DE4A54D|nr:hypothetical protein [Vallitalea guaymasensis]
MKHIVCYSGGHSSALVAIETVRRYGKENVILLNHDITSEVEDSDIKRFKDDISNYLDIGITYANMDNWENEGPLDVCMRIGAFKVGNGTALCTNRLKTEPFHNWLKKEFPTVDNKINRDCSIYYGFDAGETIRIQRRSGIMGAMGYRTTYPLAYWDRTIERTEDIGIARPYTYNTFRHANCIGCLKAGKQQWYIVYCLRPDIWEKAKEAERRIGYSIIKDVYLSELECKFENMKKLGIVPTEKVGFQKFWAMVRKIFKETDVMPCECSF